jgi:hypothetical protein
MVHSHTKNTNFYAFWKALGWEICVYFMAIWYIFMVIWYILWPFGIFCDNLVYFTRIGMLYQGNLATLVGAVVSEKTRNGESGEEVTRP